MLHKAGLTQRVDRAGRACARTSRKAGAAAAARAGGRALLPCLFQRFMDQGLDGGIAASAFGAATKAAIDGARRPRARFSLDGGTDILIGKDVAGADDHNGT